MELTVKELPALMYYNHEKERRKDTTPKAFESLEPKKQKLWKERAIKVLEAIDKCNYRIIDKKAVVTKEDRKKEVHEIKGIIDRLIKTLDFKRLNNPDYFPSEELATRIYNGEPQ